MKNNGYRQLAKRCAKHLRALHIALDGVVKAEGADQQFLIERSVTRAQQCLAEVCGCFDGFADAELTAPLVALDRALAVLTDGERVHEIEVSIRQFETLFEAKQHAPEIDNRTGRGELTYTASLRRRSAEMVTTSR